MADKMRFRDPAPDVIHAVEFSTEGDPFVTVFTTGPVPEEMGDGLTILPHDNERFHNDDPSMSWTNDGPDQGRWFNHIHIGLKEHLDVSILDDLGVREEFRMTITDAIEDAA